MVQVASYDPSWPQLFEEEAVKIKAALGKSCLAIHHVGSTAVPDLWAKPKIDIIAVVASEEGVIPRLEEIGYIYGGEFNIPFRLSFKKRTDVLKVNLYVYEEGNPEIELNLKFRDYLRSHPAAREEYSALKRELVKDPASHEKHKTRFRGYNLGKDHFIKSIIEKTGFEGLCMRLCTHNDEWEAVRHFRQKYFFDKVTMQDPYTWTFDHPDHIHFIFYKGIQILGYAHVQLWPDNRAALRIIVIDEQDRKQGYGRHFLDLIERWLQKQGFHFLLTQASPDAYAFYSHLGYDEMPFNDPEGYESDPRDVDMGKVL